MKEGCILSWRVYMRIGNLNWAKITLLFLFIFTILVYTGTPQISLRGGEWWWMMLEERFHEAADASYSDVQASGFEVVYDDAVHRSFMNQLTDSGSSLAAGFEPRLFHVTYMHMILYDLV